MRLKELLINVKDSEEIWFDSMEEILKRRTFSDK